MKLRSPTKRTLLVRWGVLFIVGGAIINVAVAWGVPCFMGPMGGTTDEISSGFGEIPWVITRTQNSVCVLVKAISRTKTCEAIHITDARVPGWSRISRLPAYNEIDPARSFWDIGFGWPMLSLRYAIEFERDRDTGTIEHQFTGSVGYPPMPYFAIWSGFAINTIFYAAILSMLFTAPGFVRRRIRIMRHRCTACGYLIGTSPVCTECGTPVRIQKS